MRRNAVQLTTMASFLRTSSFLHAILVISLVCGTLQSVNGDEPQPLPDIDPDGACKAEIALHCKRHQKATNANPSAAAKAAGEVKPRGHVHPGGSNSQQQKQKQQQHQREKQEEEQEEQRQGEQRQKQQGAAAGAKRLLLDATDDGAGQKPKPMQIALQQLKTKLNLPYAVTEPEKLLAGPHNARCIKNIMLDSFPSASYGADALSTECMQDVVKFYSDMAADTAQDYQLIAACAEAIVAHCPDTPSNSLFSCLLSNKHKTKRVCAQALSTRTAASSGLLNWNQDVAANCQSDAGKYCADELQSDADLPQIGGFALGCLREKLQTAIELNMTGEAMAEDELSDTCAQAMFRREMAESEDVLFSFELFRACSQELSERCPKVSLAKGDALLCLERQQDDWAVGDQCQLAIQANQVLRAADGRLDWRLREHCREDVLNLCSDERQYTGGLDPKLMLDDWNAPLMAAINVTWCLRRKWQSINEHACKAHVRYITARAFANTVLDGPLLRACAVNISQHCMEPSNALLCLKKLVANGLKLAPSCEDVLQERFLEAADNYDFLPEVVIACQTERKLFCEGVPPAHGAVLDCLADFRADERFGDACREALTGQFILAVSDIRLLSSLQEGCEADVQNLCPGVKPGSGRVIECLQQNSDKIGSSSCRRQLLRLRGFAAHDYRLDYHLREACSRDVDKHCAHVVPGNGRMHACLRKNQAKLTKDCRKHVETAEAQEYRDVSLNPAIHSACDSTITSLCGKLKGSITELMPCLKRHMPDPSFAPACKKALKEALARKSTKYSLQPALQKACDADVTKLCPEVAKARAAGEVIAATLTTTTAKRAMLSTAASEDDKSTASELVLSSLADVPSTRAGINAYSIADQRYIFDQQSNRFDRDAAALHSSSRAVLQAEDENGAAAAAAPTADETNTDRDPELLCLAKHLTGLSPTCKQEVAAEVHRELVLYMPGMPLTAACDEDATKLCDAGSPDVSAIVQTGSILGCLVTRPEKLSSGCWALISLFDKEQLAYAKRLEAGGSEASDPQLPHTQQPEQAVQDAVLERVTEQLQQQVASQIKEHLQTEWGTNLSLMLGANSSLMLSSEVEQYIAAVAKGAQSYGFLFGALSVVVLLAVAAGIVVSMQQGRKLRGQLTWTPDGTLVVKDANV